MAAFLDELAERFTQFDIDIWTTLRAYLRQDFQSLNEHLASRHAGLSDLLRRRTSIYLDLKYWIYMRDARMGMPQQTRHAQLLKLLETLLSDDRIICPVSSSTLHEVANIGDPDKRRWTAEVIDEFSRGLAFRPIDQRIQLEFFESWSKRERTPKRHRVARQFVWTSPSLALGMPPLSPQEAIPPNIVKAIGKVLVDSLMSMSFSQALDFLYPDGCDLPKDDDETMASIDSARRDPAAPRMTFRNELPRECESLLQAGVLIKNGRIDEPMFHPYSQPDQSLSVANKEVYDFLVAILKATAIDHDASVFPSMYLWCGLHTKGKVDRSRYTFNDLHDFDHACAAVPYCDAFFTERRLATWLRQRPLEVSSHFDCEVIGDDEGAIKYLESLL